MPELVACSALIVLALMWLVVYPPRWRERPSLLLIVSVAVVLRAMFISAPPQLSDDVYRYLWDGLQLWQGHNPYAAAPDQLAATSAQQAQLQALINHPHLVTIYPPAAQLLFAVAGGSLMAFKTLLIAFDLGSCLLLGLLLQRLGRSPWWLVLYAWHPLAVLECGSSGHVDTLAVFFVLAAVVAAGGRYAGLISGASLAVAVLIKVLPLIFVPFVFLLMPSRQRRLFVVTFVLSSLALLLPFMPQLLQGVDTLGLYARHWEFSGFNFQLLRRVLGSGDQARLVLAALFGAVLAGQWWRLYQLSRRCQADLLSALVAACSRFLLLFLLLTPTLHPWYALYLLAFLPLRPTAAAVVLSWSVLLSYQVVAAAFVSGQWQESFLLTFYVWSAPVAALLASGWLFLRQRRASN